MEGSKPSAGTAAIILRFVREAFRHRKLLVLIALSILGASLSTLAAPYLLGVAIDKYIIPGNLAGLPKIASLYLLALLGQWLFTTLQMWYVEIFGQRVLMDLRSRLQEKILRSNMDFFKDKKAGDLVSRIINDTNMVNDVLVSGLLGGLGSMLSLIGIVIAMLLLEPRLTLAALLSVPLMVYTAKHFGGRIRSAYRETRRKIAKISSVVEESVSGIETIKVFGREQYSLKEFEQAANETVKAYMKVAFYMGFFWPLMNISSLLSIIIVIGYGGYLAYTGAVSIGVVVAFIQYTQRFRGPINNVVSMYDSLQSALASLERIYEILDSKQEESDEGISVERLEGHIEFRNVWFEYERNRPVLKNVNLEIRPGEIVALVGRTGAGKTTIANLIMRFYDPTRGAVLLDGMDSRRIKRSSLRRRIAYVPQETYLFNGTILENILVAKPGASREEVEKVCRELGVHDFIMRLPKGYDTPAGEAGKLLSVGEKQLISIARAMLKNPDIVILDEALSSVDPKTESIVQNALLRLMEGRTSIIVAHRLTIARHADKIVVVEEGRIVEEGSFDELMRKEGKFYALYTSQMREAVKTIGGSI